MLKIGSTDINKVYLGADEIVKTYLGEGLVFSNTPTAPLRFASPDNTFNDSNPAVSPKYHASADRALCVKPYKLAQDYSTLAFVFSNAGLTAGSGGGPGNTLEWLALEAQYGGVSVTIIFDGGSSSLTLEDGQVGVPSLEIEASAFGFPKFAKGEFILFKGIAATPALGGRFVCQNISTDLYQSGGQAMGQFSLYSSAEAVPSDIKLIGKFTYVSGAAASNVSATTCAPLLVGRAINRKRPAVMGLYDSIGTRFASSENLNTLFDDGVFPQMTFAMPGIDVMSFINFDGLWMWAKGYADLIDIHLGDNDIASSKSTWESNNSYDFWNTSGGLKWRYESLYERCSGIPLMQSHLLMPSTSSDNWSTPENQVPVPHWEPVMVHCPAFFDAKVLDGTLIRAHSVSAIRDTNGAGKDVWAGEIAFDNTRDGIHLSNQSDNGAASLYDTGVGRYDALILYPDYRSVAVEWYGPEAPTKPQNVILAPGDAEIAVSWSSSQYNGGAPMTYTVLYKPASDPMWIVGASGLSDTTHLLGSIDNGTEYDVMVMAVNVAGYSESAVFKATPTAVSYDPNIATVLDVRSSTMTYNGTKVSSAQDARGSNIFWAQANDVNRPTQAAPGAGLYCGNNQWLTLDRAVNPLNFDMVFEKDAAVGNASPTAMLLYFADVAPVTLALGASTGTVADEVIVFGVSTYRAYVTAANLLADTGLSTIPTGLHAISVRYVSGSKAVIMLDGIDLTVSENGSNVQSVANYVPTFGAQATGASDFFGTIYEARLYSAAPVEAVAVTQANLMSSWSI